MANKSIRKKKFILIKKRLSYQSNHESLHYHASAVTIMLFQIKFNYLKNIYIFLRQRRVFCVKNFLSRYIVGTAPWLHVSIP